MKRKLKVHFMGVGGSGAGGVAKIAEKMGFIVSGCDEYGSTPYYEKAVKGHSKNHLKDVDLLVVSPAILYQNKDNEEYLEGLKKGIVLTWQEFLGKYLMGGKTVICIAGTHGKSTTTAMAGKLLSDAGFDPTVLLGAKSIEWGENFRLGKGKYFIVEADEFNDNFLHYSPEIIILNNIEFDHPDFFKDEERVFLSFEKFIGKLTGKKILIANLDDSGVVRLLKKIADTDIKVIGYCQKENSLEFTLKVLGEYNRQNAFGVISLGKELGIRDDVISKSLNSYTGIARRSQILGVSKKGFLVIDDYAHHPTAIKKTLEAIRNAYKDKIIWVIIEPHGYERTKALGSLYKGIFSSVDKVIIGPIFRARDKKIPGITSQLLAKISMHKDATAVESYTIIENLIKKAGSNDIVVVMGAGESHVWAEKLLKV